MFLGLYLARCANRGIDVQRARMAGVARRRCNHRRWPDHSGQSGNGPCLGKGGALGRLYIAQGVLAYREWDTQNIWKAGDAAFMRSWNGLPGPYRLGPTQTPSVDAKNYHFAPLPAGKGGSVSTFGGHGYAVSKYSAQVQAAVKLVRFRAAAIPNASACGPTQEIPRSLTCIKILAYEPRPLISSPCRKCIKKLLLHDLLQQPERSIPRYRAPILKRFIRS